MLSLENRGPCELRAPSPIWAGKSGGPDHTVSNALTHLFISSALAHPLSTSSALTGSPCTGSTLAHSPCTDKALAHSPGTCKTHTPPHHPAPGPKPLPASQLLWHQPVARCPEQSGAREPDSSLGSGLQREVHRQAGSGRAGAGSPSLQMCPAQGWNLPAMPCSQAAPGHLGPTGSLQGPSPVQAALAPQRAQENPSSSHTHSLYREKG